jgi:hypothetical protein
MKLLAILLLGLAASACGARRSGPEVVTGTGDGERTGTGTGTAAESTPHQRRAECGLPRAGCHDVNECHGRGICEPALPTSDYGCGIPPRHVEACKADADCSPSGQVCNAYSIGCEVGHRCEGRCETATCAEGQACRADGRCSALRCPDEWTCADYGTCKPPLPNEGLLQGGRDWHGCVPLACKSDGDCPCANCVNSSCTPIPGRCIEARG